MLSALEPPVFVHMQDAKWTEVVIDTLIPCFKADKTPIFARNKVSCELWAMFLEKAYAKYAGR